MNSTVAMLTVRTLLGRRRAWLLLALPGVLVLLSVVVRLTVDEADRTDVAVGLLGAFGIATVLPLLSLIAGTGAIGGEIDDGSIVYLLAKPLRRDVIVVTKLLVAVGVVAVLGALPMTFSGLVLVGGDDRLAVGFGLEALLAGAAYCALFVLLSVLTRNAVVIGLVYALVWESLVGSVVPGAQALSIQQWSVGLNRIVVGSPADSLGLTSAVRPAVGIPLLVALIVGCAWFAGQRLRSLRLTSAE